MFLSGLRQQQQPSSTSQSASARSYSVWACYWSCFTQEIAVSTHLDPSGSVFRLDRFSRPACPDPWTGRAQVKKLVLFLFIPLLYTVFLRQLGKAFYVLIGWTATATASALWGFVQFIQKYETAKRQERISMPHM